MSRIERKYCLISTSCLAGLSDIFTLRFIFDIIVCILVSFHQWGHLAMVIIRNLNLNSVQPGHIWTWWIVNELEKLNILNELTSDIMFISFHAFMLFRSRFNVFFPLPSCRNLNSNNITFVTADLFSPLKSLKFLYA